MLEHPKSSRLDVLTKKKIITIHSLNVIVVSGFISQIKLQLAIKDFIE